MTIICDQCDDDEDFRFQISDFRFHQISDFRFLLFFFSSTPKRRYCGLHNAPNQLL